MNFYDRLKIMCEEKGIKITTLVVECGGNKGSIASWKTGSIPNYGIVSKLADRLDVSVDYLVGNEDINIQPRKYFKTIDILRASKYKYINLSTINEITEEDAQRYAEYLNCGLKFVLNRTSIKFAPVKAKRKAADIDTDMTEDVIDLMGALPGSDDVRFLQIQISRIVLYNLEQAGFDSDTVREWKSLNSANLDFLLSDEFDYIKAGAYGFTSDELRSVRRKCGLSYQYLFSGVKKNKDKSV